MAETLLFFDGTEIDAARAAVSRGDTLVAFSEKSAGALLGAGIRFVQSIDSLGDDPEMTLYRAAADWTRGFGERAKSGDGQTLRDALRFRKTTLWWWAELYLHHNTEAVTRVRFLETAARVLERSGASNIRTHGLGILENDLIRRFAAIVGVNAAIGPSAQVPLPARKSAMLSGMSEASKLVATAIRTSSGEDERLVANSLVFVSHAAFWRTRTLPGGRVSHYEHYFDSILEEAARRSLKVVKLAVGPQSTFRTRTGSEKWKERLRVQRDDRFVHINRFVTPRLAAAALRAFGKGVRINRLFQNERTLADAFSHRGVSFGDASSQDLAFVLLHQVPWAARCLLEFEAAFEHLTPKLVCLYAESSGLGRAAIESARIRGVKTLGLQHGILYPNYFSYERTTDDVEQGTPIPDMTATYGADGVRLLEKTFHYPKGRVTATGSPRYDALSEEMRATDRAERRANLGVKGSETLIVLASRYKGIRDTHKASGPAFRALLDAIGRLRGSRLIVKPHPAEPVDAYDADIAASGLEVEHRVRVVSDRSLTEILPAADLLVTVESLSATEALVANVPVVVLRHPSNLRDVVASGAARGVPDGVDPLPTIEALLHDGKARSDWKAARDAYLIDVAHGIDGRSLERLLGLIEGMAEGSLTGVRVPAQ